MSLHNTFKIFLEGWYYFVLKEFSWECLSALIYFEGWFKFEYNITDTKKAIQKFLFLLVFILASCAFCPFHQCCFFLVTVLFTTFPCVCAVAQLCLNLCGPMDCSLPGSSVGTIFQARVWSRVSLPTPEHLSASGIQHFLMLWMPEGSIVMLHL